MRNPIVPGGSLGFAAATIAEDTFGTSISTSFRMDDPRSDCEPTYWTRNERGLSSKPFGSSTSAGAERLRAARTARSSATSEAGPSPPILRATAKATRSQSLAIASELASYSRQRASEYAAAPANQRLSLGVDALDPRASAWRPEPQHRKGERSRHGSSTVN